MSLLGKKGISHTYRLGGLTCNMCVMKVTKVVKELHGVKKAAVSPDMKELTVSGSHDMDPDAVVVAVTGAGYVAEKSG